MRKCGGGLTSSSPSVAPQPQLAADRSGILAWPHPLHILPHAVGAVRGPPAATVPAGSSEVPMLARLRMLFAMSLLCLGTWCATRAVEGHWPTGATMRIDHGAPSPGLSAAPDTQQFISFLTRERFVVEPAPATKPRLKSQL